MENDEMIQGFKLRITCNELMKHCVERAGFHQKRADDKDSQLPGLKSSMAAIKADTNAAALAHMNKSSTFHDDPVESLENSIRDHRNKALVFRFFAEHLFDEDYTLEESDLTRLEILKR